MKILYKKILALELWHDYYLGQPDPRLLLQTDYDISDLLALVPTPECLRVLQNLHWVFRPQPHGANLFAQVDETTTGDFQTRIAVDRPYRLTFWLVVRDSQFANFTNLPLTGTRNKIYYFSNLSGNQGHDLFLTQPLPTYAANAEYLLGDLVTHDGQFINHDGQLVNYNGNLEASHYQASATTIPEASDWETLSDSQYVSVLDQLTLQRLSRTHTITIANPRDTFRFTLVNVNKQEVFAFELTVPDNHPPGKAIAVNLNFSDQAPGCYQLHLNNTQVDKFILCDPAIVRNAFALVEIVLDQNLVPPAFSLLQFQDGKTLIQPKTYVIRFKNRATYWRYRYEKPHGFTEEDLPDFELEDDKTYFSKRPQGLLRRPKRLLTDGNDNLLPAPEVMLIKPETQIDPATQKQAIAIFSDIHL